MSIQFILSLIVTFSISINSSAAEPAEPTEPPQSDVKKLLEIFQLAIEGEEEEFAGFREFMASLKKPEAWKEFLENYQFQDIALRGIRAYKIQSQNEDLKNHAKNMAFIFPLSHGIEMTAGPAFISYGISQGLPASVISIGGSALSIISIPGLDPLCLLIFAAYPLTPVHKNIDASRRLTERVLSFSYKVSGLQTLIDRSTSIENRLELLSEGLMQDQLYKKGLEITSSPKGYHFNWHRKEDTRKTLSLALEFEVSDTNSYLKTVRLPKNKDLWPQSIIDLRIFAKLFPWNVRKALLEVADFMEIDNLQRLEPQFYIESIAETDLLLNITYENLAIEITKKRLFLSGSLQRKALNRKINKCSELLAPQP